MQQLDIIGKRKWFYLASSVVLVPGFIALLLWGLRLGIDFTGGSLLELRFEQDINSGQVMEQLDTLGFTDSTVQVSEKRNALIRTRTLEVDTTAEASSVSATNPVEESTPTDPALETSTDESTENSDAAPSNDTSVTSTDQTVDSTLSSNDTATERVPDETTSVDSAAAVNEKQLIIDAMRQRFGNVEEISFESIGPTIGKELTRKAVYAVLAASLGIILYLAWAFRQVPKPASSVRFGICAIAALLHDVLFLLGAFAILGHFFDVEVNGMFLVATLTVMGFSVHDSIVVFDRIREMLKKEIGQPFQKIVNDSILETLGRSINTTLTVLLTLLALVLFGGESIRVFTFALLIGVFSGAYSSIFNASPLLVDWQRWVDSRASKSS